MMHEQENRVATVFQLSLKPRETILIVVSRMSSRLIGIEEQQCVPGHFARSLHKAIAIVHGIRKDRAQRSALVMIAYHHDDRGRRLGEAGVQLFVGFLLAPVAKIACYNNRVGVAVIRSNAFECCLQSSAGVHPIQPLWSGNEMCVGQMNKFHGDYIRWKEEAARHGAEQQQCGSNYLRGRSA